MVDLSTFKDWIKGNIDGDNFAITVRNHYFPEIWYIVEAFFSLSTEKTVLDLGCGNGLIAEAMAKSGWNVTCVDSMVECLLKTQERFSHSELEGRFEQAHPEELPFGNESFNHVVCINLLEATGSRTRTLREIHRVLKPGGTAVITTIANMSQWSRSSLVRNLRMESKSDDCRFYSKKEFVKMLLKERFKIDRLKGCARYMPSSGTKKINMPIIGAYTALVTKPHTSTSSSPNEETQMNS